MYHLEENKLELGEGETWVTRMLNPAGVLFWGLKPSTTYKRVFLLMGFSLGICRVLGFCRGVTGFYILGGWG